MNENESKQNITIHIDNLYTLLSALFFTLLKNFQYSSSLLLEQVLFHLFHAIFNGKCILCYTSKIFFLLFLCCCVFLSFENKNWRQHSDDDDDVRLKQHAIKNKKKHFPLRFPHLCILTSLTLFFVSRNSEAQNHVQREFYNVAYLAAVPQAVE